MIPVKLVCLVSILVLSAQVVAAQMVGAQEELDARTQHELAQAQRLLDTHRTRRARILLKRSLRRAPSVQAAALAGRLLPRLPDAARPSPEQLDDARWILDMTEALEGAEVEQVRGWSLALLGRHDDAIESMRLRAQHAPSAEALHDMAALFAARDALLDAEHAMQRALRILPQSRDLQVALAALLVARGRPDAAIQILLGVLGFAPDDHEARRDLAGALMAAGRHEEAISTLRHLEQVADDPTDSILLADAALELGRHRVAEDAARRAIAAGAAIGHASLALALAAQGRRNEALQALADAPDDVRARRARRVLESPNDG